MQKLVMAEDAQFVRKDHFELCKRKSPLDDRESLQLHVKVSEKSLNILSAIRLATQGT